MTETVAALAARVIADAIDRLVAIGVPMDPTVKAGIAAQSYTVLASGTPQGDASLMTTAATLLASMTDGRPEYAAVVGALIPALNMRAEALAQTQSPNVIAAQQLFPQRTR